MAASRIFDHPYPPTAGRAPTPRSLPRPGRRERDFGIGYGSSDGYGRERRYRTVRPASYFHCS